ncbi:MAG: hypothetical protein APR53_00855 [Methanoculleus sp. SDB]|nr:MAG: hypothetical protein APR53_00855 [Methanoculleus sp. SDB]
MTEGARRNLNVSDGTVQCTENKRETVEHCRFCVHSTAFYIGTARIDSPARAYCTRDRTTTDVDLKRVTGVECDDQRSEGYRSIMNIIS